VKNITHAGNHFSPCTSSHAAFFIVNEYILQSAPTTAPLVWRQHDPAIIGDGVFDGLGTSMAMSKNGSAME
jgi:hypothetical protein